MERFRKNGEAQFAMLKDLIGGAVALAAAMFDKFTLWLVLCAALLYTTGWGYYYLAGRLRKGVKH